MTMDETLRTRLEALFRIFRAGGPMSDRGTTRINERLHVEKFDHSAAAPALVEYQIRDGGQCVHREARDA